MNPRSIRFRLIAWFAGLLTLVLLVFGAYLYSRLQDFLLEAQGDALKHRTEQIATMLGEAPRVGEPLVAAQIEARFAPALNDKFVRVTHADGSPVFLSAPPNDRTFDPASVRRAASVEEIRREPGLGPDLLVATHEVRVGAQGYRIEVGASLGASNRVLHSLLLTLAAGLPAVMGLAILGGYVLIRRALDPVQQIMGAAQDITLHHLSRRLPVPESGDEIAGLSLVLNQMIARLDESFQNTSRFTADASHELRTPLTIIRGELEALLLRGELSAPVRDTLASTLEEIERLVRIVEGLFALSRLDTGEAQTERHRFDLAQLAGTTAEQMCLLAEEKQITLLCHTDEPVEVEGDRSRLKQTIVNLLDNAIKYTPERGQVTLTVSARDQRAVIEVADTGPGVSAAALPHLFERFFRADDVRSREIGGAGLGLSIVQAICTAHGGTVAARNTEPCGCQFTLEIPAAL